MTNVTISMDESDLAWVRAQAGQAGVSVSRWLASRALAVKKADTDLEVEMLAVFSTPLARMSDGGRTFDREECYDRLVMKRFR